VKKQVPVQLSLMTPCVPTLASGGKVIFAPANAQARAVELNYDPKIIVPKIETIPLTDDWLVARWGKSIYRVMLTSIAPTDNGKWNIEFA
jgi:hypothetical protein